MVDMDSNYPNDIQFAGLVEAATAAADAHQRDLGKRKRGDEHAYIPVSTNEAALSESSKAPTLSNSAAILFREPSEKSKKYSRPPLGKVFTSLQLAPEAFLRLQHAAKAYMLSDEFPERKDVVGHKKLANNNDVAKLKLYECVEEFLQQDNIGEQFFGHSSSEDTADAQPRTFFWPEDRNKIVKLLMPLLRKMVTNERQRIYAAETRKQDPRRGEDKIQKSKSSAMLERETVGSTAELVRWSSFLVNAPNIRDLTNMACRHQKSIRLYRMGRNKSQQQCSRSSHNQRHRRSVRLHLKSTL